IDPQTGRAKAGTSLVEIVGKHSFNINAEKTSLRQRTQSQMVTGLIANEFPNVPRKYVRSLRTLLYMWQRYGEASAAAHFADQRNRPPYHPKPKFRHVVRGRVQYLGSIKGWHSTVYRDLSKNLTAVN